MLAVADGATWISAHVAPVEDDFAGVAGAHGVEALFIVAPVHAMCDDLGDVETALEHDRHLVPGLVHLAPVDAADGELVEDDLVPVDRDVFGWDAEHGDLCAVAHVGEHLAEGAGIAGHLQADVEALMHVEFLLDLFERCGTRVDGEGDSNFGGELAAVLVGVRDDDVAGSGVASYSSRHDADGTGSRDEDVFAEDGKGERGMNGVAEGVEDGSDLVGDAGGVAPDVGHRDDDVLGEGSVAIDTNAEGMSTEVTAAGEAVAAASADNVAFSADELAYREIGDIGADGDDFADKLVADDETLADGGASPGVPIVDVEVGAADACVEDADLYVIDAHLGLGYILEPEAAFITAFYECLHGECLSCLGSKQWVDSVSLHFFDLRDPH